MPLVIELPKWSQLQKRDYQELQSKDGLLVPLPRTMERVTRRSQPGLFKRKVFKSGRHDDSFSPRRGSTTQALGTPPMSSRDLRTHRAESEKEVMLRDIELDEPERFMSQNRLRSRGKTHTQLLLRKLKNRRRRCISVSSDSSTSGESSESTSAVSTSGLSLNEFIIADRLSSSNVELPACFSLNSAQSPEYRFKVVFHYLLLLVVSGPTVLPLRGELAEYFDPQLRHFRRTLSDIRDSRVRSQIWRHAFVQALQSRPDFLATRIEPAREGCDACHQSGRLSPYSISIEGRPYDPRSHNERITLPAAARTTTASRAIHFTLGKFCKAGAELYHELTHYEHHLYLAVRRQYQELLDALARSREEHKLSREVLPTDSRDVDAVLEWMDRRGDQQKHYRLYQNLLDRASGSQVGRRAMVD